MNDRFGLKAKNITKINEIFTFHTEVEQVILYGSRAKGNYNHGSDIDLTIKGKNLNFSKLLKIEMELDDLLLPYKIDLSIFKQIENPALISHIQRIGIVFYHNNLNCYSR